MDGISIRRLGWARSLLLAGVLVAFAVAAASASAASPVYIADYTSPGAILKLNPQTGKVSTVASGAPLSQPSGITVANNGKLLVSDDGANAIFRVDPASGSVHEVASGPFVFPFDLEQSQEGSIYVTDADAGPGGTGAVFRVNPTNGNVSTVVQGGNLLNPWGLALGKPGKLFLADDQESSSGKNGRIFKVNVAQKSVRIVASGGKLVDPTGLQFGPGGDLFTTDYAGGPNDSGAVFRVDPGNGNVKTVRSGPPLDETFGIDFNSQGKMFIPASPDTDDDPAVFRMTTSGGALTTFLSANLLEPYGVAVGD
jgi:streptogramin lyase